MIEVDNKKVQYELRKKISECIEKISDIEALERLLNFAEFYAMAEDDDGFDLSGMPVFGPKTYEEAMDELKQATGDYENGKKGYVPLEEVIKESYKQVEEYASAR